MQQIAKEIHITIYAMEHGRENAPQLGYIIAYLLERAKKGEMLLGFEGNSFSEKPISVEKFGPNVYGIEDPLANTLSSAILFLGFYHLVRMEQKIGGVDPDHQYFLEEYKKMFRKSLKELLETRPDIARGLKNPSSKNVDSADEEKLRKIALDLLRRENNGDKDLTEFIITLESEKPFSEKMLGMIVSRYVFERRNAAIVENIKKLVKIAKKRGIHEIGGIIGQGHVVGTADIDEMIPKKLGDTTIHVDVMFIQ